MTGVGPDSRWPPLFVEWLMRPTRPFTAGHRDAGGSPTVGRDGAVDLVGPLDRPTVPGGFGSVHDCQIVQQRFGIFQIGS